MAFNCVTAGEKHCEIGADLFDLLAQKKVDLVLQGHEHGYERSGQFALNPTTCPAIPISPNNTGTPSYNQGCVVDNGASGNYTKGAGPVLVIDGTAGIVTTVAGTGSIGSRPIDSFTSLYALRTMIAITAAPMP